MKIVNIESGKPYQLSPDTELSVERTNPFFHDYGEQTLPVALPDSPYNRMLLNLPGVIQRKKKVEMVEASIQDGEYFSACRQAVLAVTPNESIETSFYMNDGSFYSRLGDTYITDVFGNEKVPGVTTVDQAIEWITNIWLTGGNEIFACFQVQVEDEEGKRTLNLWDRQGLHMGSGFYHAIDRVEKYKSTAQDDTRPGRVTHGGNYFIPKGFYLTPFLKTNFVLKRLFAHFGYTLQNNFFTHTEQFQNMVFLNNVADAIVTGTISLSQLVPKVSCKKILNLFRKKFCCEFVTDEVAKTATIVLMSDIVGNYSKDDLTDFLVGKPKVNYPESYQQIVLKSGNSVGSDNESSLDSLDLIRKQYPTAQFSKERGQFYRDGFIYKRAVEKVREVVANTSQPYNVGGQLQSKEIEIPEAIPATLKYGSLFIGRIQYLNSSLRYGNLIENQAIDDDEKKSSDDSMDLMLAFVYRNGSYTGGTVTNYGSNGLYSPAEEYKRIGDYSLIYNGDCGIFEKFYKLYDTLLRNSLHSVEANLLLSQRQKQEIRSINKITIDGSDYLIDSLKFSLGTKAKTVESKLLTLQLYEPIDSAKSLAEIVPPLVSTGYKWEPKTSSVQITKEEYEKSPYKDVDSPTIYPPQATASDTGRRFYERKAALYFDASHPPRRDVRGESWWLYTFWLEVVPDV